MTSDEMWTPGACIATAIWRCRKPFSEWQLSFQMKAVLPSTGLVTASYRNSNTWPYRLQYNGFTYGQRWRARFRRFHSYNHYIESHGMWEYLAMSGGKPSNTFITHTYRGQFSTIHIRTLPRSTTRYIVWKEGMGAGWWGGGWWRGLNLVSNV